MNEVTMELPQIAFAYGRLQAEADAETEEIEKINKSINAFGVFQNNRETFRDGAAAIFLRQLGSASPEHHEWHLAFNIGSALLFATQGDRDEALEGAIYWLERALAIPIREIAASDWARTQGELATAYKNRISGDKPQNFATAHQHLAEALTVFTPELHFKEWLHTIRQRAYLRLEKSHGDRMEQLADIERAIAELECVVQHVDRASDSELWRTTMDALATSYADRRLGSTFANWEKSVGIYEEVLGAIGNIDEALAAQDTKKAVHIAGVYLNFANVLQKRRGGERDENARRALDLLRRSHAFFTKTNRGQVAAHLAERIAAIERELGQDVALA
jgi:tetratricopeptide (TPR) repeat protein